jgi:hypothetical protein
MFEKIIFTIAALLIAAAIINFIAGSIKEGIAELLLAVVLWLYLVVNEDL